MRGRKCPLVSSKPCAWATYHHLSVLLWRGHQLLNSMNSPTITPTPTTTTFHPYPSLHPPPPTGSWAQHANKSTKVKASSPWLSGISWQLPRQSYWALGSFNWCLLDHKRSIRKPQSAEAWLGPGRGGKGKKFNPKQQWHSTAIGQRKGSSIWTI